MGSACLNGRPDFLTSINYLFLTFLPSSLFPSQKGDVVWLYGNFLNDKIINVSKCLAMVYGVRDHVHKDIYASSVVWSTRSITGNKQEEVDILEDHTIEVGWNVPV